MVSSKDSSYAALTFSQVDSKLVCLCGVYLIIWFSFVIVVPKITYMLPSVSADEFA